jgi:small-conductance mechanosensitive channel
MKRTFLTVLAVISLFWAAIVQAQEEAEAPIDYTAWEQLADLTETTIDKDDATIDEFEVLRGGVIKFRARFETARLANSGRIDALRTQIEALGPKPDMVEEPQEVAAKRAELERQLIELQSPAQVADAAFRRADAIVGQIDRIIRDRDKKRLLSLGASPLAPSNWKIMFNDVGDTLRAMAAETESRNDPERQRALRDKAPLVIFLLALSLALIFRGRHWAGLAGSLLRRLGGRGSGVWTFIISLFRIILPLIGVIIFAQALRETGLAGPMLSLILDALPIWGAFLLGIRWLAERLFSRLPEEALIPLSKEKRSQARFYMLVLSIFFVLRGIVHLIQQYDSMQPEAEAVIAFPIVIVISLALAALGQIMRGYRGADESTDEEEPRGTSLARALRFAGSGMIAVAVAAPVMAAVGYAEAGNALLYPTVMTMLVLGFVMTLQRFCADVYGLFTGLGEQARDALVPILIGFVLVVLSLPVLALVWGARMADLIELWESFTRGFVVGETRFSPSDFLTFAIVFAIGYSVTRLLQAFLKGSVLPKTKLDIGGQNAVVSGLGYVGIFLAAVIAITMAGLDLSNLAIVAGALSVGIGFGLQTIVSNFVSGIILLVERPISEGDWIEVGGQMGYVRDISVRSTRIETFDRTDVIVPNADLVSGTVTNYTRGNTVGRLIVPIGVAYGTDTRRVEKILMAIAKAQPMVLNNPPPAIIFHNFGADALEFEIRVFLRDVNWILSVRNDINHAIAESFAKEGIEVPFAQRDVWLRNPESLKAPEQGTS